MSWIDNWARMLREGQFETLNRQEYNLISEFSREWNTFVFYESARAANQIGFGNHPIAFINDSLFTGS